MLAVRLLGQFEVQRDGAPLAIPSRLGQSLLAYLLLTAGTAHRREKLAGLLWPDTTDDNARRNLRQELWRLRKAIEPAVPGKPAATYLQITEVTLAFDPQSDFWLDAAVMANHNTEHAAAQELIDVLALYHGELLPGFYDEWVVLERERLHAIFERKIARLLDLLVEEKRWHAVLEWAERWIALGHSPEPAYRALMSAHGAMGDRSKVGVVFERCARALRADLNLEPSAQTRALFLQLSTDSSPLRADSAPAAPQSPAANLPVPLTRLIGRERESGEVRRLLSTTRLLTLTGSGGVGKTRLAIRIAADSAAEFSDGTWWVGLAALTDGALVAQQVAKSLRLRESPSEPLSETLASYLRARHTLLLLDNCEHLIGACAQFAEALLGACPNLKILATSREALGITGEVVWRVPSLMVPASHAASDTASSLSSDGVRLFVDRAQAVNPGFQLTEQNAMEVAQICRRLDGIPLAIELAAARVNVLTPGQIATRLDDRFHLLTSGSRTVLPRHQTLRALIDWSYELLSDPERVLWRRLSIFVGGFTLDAVGAVCTDDGGRAAGTGIKPADTLDLLTKLIAKSLVVVEPGEAQLRYSLLETMRQYAHDRLSASGEIDRLCRAHLEYHLRLAEDAEPQIQGPNQTNWLDRLELEHGNLRAALQWAEKNGAPGAALRLVCALGRFWEVRGYLTEARERLDGVLLMPAAREPQWASWRARALGQAGYMAILQSDYAAAGALIQEGMALYRELDDQKGIAYSLNCLFLAAWTQGDIVSARAFGEESLAIRRALGDKPGVAFGLKNLGLALREGGDYDAARAFIEESLVLQRELGDPRGIAISLMDAGATAHAQGDPAASALLEESLAIFRKLGDKLNVARCLHDLGAVAARQDDPVLAKTRFAASLTLFHELGDRRNLVKCLEGLAGVSAAEGRLEKAARLFGASEALRQALRTPLPASYRADYERNMSLLRARLDKARIAAAWAEGRAMTTDQAVAYALEDRPAD